MIIDNNDMNVNRTTEDKTAAFLTNLASELVALVHGAVRTVKNWNKEAEADKATYLMEQERRNAFLWFLQIQRFVKVLMATALNTVPAHIIFYGIISPHNLRVSLMKKGIIRVSVPSDMSGAPHHFHIFRDELQEVLDSLYRVAIDTLRDRIMSDAWYIQSVILSNQWTVAEEHRFLQAYWDLYFSMYERLFKISGISVQRQPNGFSVDIRVLFNDCGLHPDNYFLNIRSVI